MTAYEIALYHHENWDGTGYFGLSGNDIPLAARIFRLADVYDTLRSKKPYKSRLSHKEATQIIFDGDKKTSSEHFDPKLLETFKNMSSIFEKIGDNILVCDYWEASKKQLDSELSRGLDLGGTQGFRKMGCYECQGGLNVTCDGYSTVFAEKR